MNEENIYKCLALIHEFEKNKGPCEIDDSNLKWLHERKYIMCQFISHGRIVQGPYLLSYGKVFLENYDSSYSAKVDRYFGKYPDLTKSFYFIIGLVAGLIPFLYTLIN